jgi:acetolactate synthase-1/2/3 large subunit
MSDQNLNESILSGYGIVRFLKSRGVRHMFGIPDGHTLALYDGIQATAGIEHVLFNDERSAAFAADAYARVTGTLSVCDAGAAGSMNFPVALTEAKGSASPVLAIVGVVKSTDVLKNIPHDINVSKVLEAVTKWTGTVLNPEYLPRFLKYAVKQAINGRPGPTALVIAEDVMNSREIKLKEFVERVNKSCSLNSCRSAPIPSEIDQAISLIEDSKQPAIYSGSGALISGAFEEIRTLSNLLQAPVFSTISGKGIMTSQISNDNLYFGTVGLFGEKPNHKFIRTKSDLLIVIGNRLTEDDTANFKVPTGRMEIIQIDIDPAEIGLSYNPWGVVGDPKETLKILIEQLRTSKASNFKKDGEIMKNRQKNIEILIRDHKNYRESDNMNWINAEPIKPQRILKNIAENMESGDYLVTDASASSRWIGPYFPVKSIGRHIITPRGVGPTGFGVGALIGTIIASKEQQPDKKSNVILFTGDGGLMNGGLSEFETIKKLDLDCVITVINNNSLGFVKFGQAMLFKHRYFETERPVTNFAKICEAFGGIGYHVNRLSELDSTLKDANKEEGFRLIDIQIDPMELLPPNFY